jgi:hypothetical protein
MGPPTIAKPQIEDAAMLLSTFISGYIFILSSISA